MPEPENNDDAQTDAPVVDGDATEETPVADAETPVADAEAPAGDDVEDGEEKKEEEEAPAAE